MTANAGAVVIEAHPVYQFTGLAREHGDPVVGAYARVVVAFAVQRVRAPQLIAFAASTARRGTALWRSGLSARRSRLKRVSPAVVR